MIHRNSTLRFSRTPSIFRNFLILATLVALFAPMNFVLITPGPATPLFPKVLTIDSDIKSYPVNGQLNLLTIYVTNPETRVFGAEVLGCWAWGDCAALPRSVMYEEGATDKAENKSGAKDMQESQNLALIAARGAIARRYPNLDISHVTDASIKVSLKNTGGPSGGLIFTLGLVDLLTPADLLQKRNIAGTGTIAKDGTVGPIGGVTEKILGAKKAGATILFVSQDNCSELPARVDGISVIAIKKVDQAIDYLLAPISRDKSSGIRGCASVGA